MNRKSDYLKKETLYSFERIATLSKKDNKSGRKRPRAIMHDIREEHKIGMHVTLVYHPYKLIYHAEQVPENETSGCRGKHMKTIPIIVIQILMVIIFHLIST